MSDILRSIFNEFDPRPLTASPADQELYVDLDDVRGETGSVAAKLARSFQFAKVAQHLLLTGHKGCGKSTEIHKVARLLETGAPKFFVVVCEANKELDLTDVDLPELLVAMLRSLAERLEAKPLEIKLRPDGLMRRLGEVWELLKSDVEFKDISLNTGLVEVGLGMKSGPTKRKQLREGIEDRTGGWIEAANEFIGEAIKALKPFGYERLLLVVDALDKLILMRNERADCDAGEYLFVRRADELTRIETHVLYTLPIDLHYSHVGPRVEAAFGDVARVIPMVKIRHKPPSVEPHMDGIMQLRKLVNRHLVRLGLSEDQAFEPGVLDLFLAETGGQPSELLNFIKDSAIHADSAPIPMAAARQVVRQHRRAFAAALTLGRNKDILRAIAATGDPPEGVDDMAFRELLASRAVLRYMNDEGWFAVNPLVDVPPPLATAPAGGAPSQ